MKNRLTLAGILVGIGLLMPAWGHAAKAPHMEKEVEGPVVFIRPELQDLGTTVTPIKKVVFHENSFNSSDTTLTLDLVHHKGTAIMGTARFRAVDAYSNISINFPVGGKTKLKRQKISLEDGSTTKVIVPGFSLKGSALYQGTSISLTLSAKQTSFDANEAQTTSAISLAGYEFLIKINGLPNKFDYTAAADVRGHFNFGFELAPDSVGGKKPSEKYDYYYIWTTGIRNYEIGKGTFRKSDSDGVFTLKAPKIKLTATDFDYEAPFDPEYIKLKTPVAKFTGDANEF